MLPTAQSFGAHLGTIGSAKDEEGPNPWFVPTSFEVPMEKVFAKAGGRPSAFATADATRLLWEKGGGTSAVDEADGAQRERRDPQVVGRL